MDPDSLPILVAILGPTASGKSDLALQIAAHCHGEVINCDSLQVYRGFDIGTAKIGIPKRLDVPHHLIDIAEPSSVYTAGDFIRDAREILSDLAARRRLPVIAGGTGFYLRALLNGLAPAPHRDEGLRSRLASREHRKAQILHRYLRRLDPLTARRIHPNDLAKTLRAVEISVLSRRRASDVFTLGRNPLAGYRILKLGLTPPRDQLNERIGHRSKAMFDAGLIDEVRSLLASGVPPTAKPFGSIGYTQALAVLDGRMTVDQAVADTALRTRQYVKRQLTWFRREPDVVWLEGFGDDAAIQTEALSHVTAFN